MLSVNLIPFVAIPTEGSISKCQNENNISKKKMLKDFKLKIAYEIYSFAITTASLCSAKQSVSQ